jgi:hypothetical protein
VGVVFGFVEVGDVRIGVLESKPGSLVLVGAFLEERVVLMQWSFPWEDVEAAAAVCLDS